MKKILLIEDNLEIRENTAEILELANYEVVTAENGKVGVSKAKSELPDIIICDIMMPELDGYGVLRILSRDPLTMGIPFLFLTAKADKTDFRKGMTLGADDYLTKPFEEVELLDTIERRLEKASYFIDPSSSDSKESIHFFNQTKVLDKLASLIGDQDKMVYKKKQILFSEGSRPYNVYFINKGKVKCYLTNEHGKELITSIHVKGDFIGYQAILEDRLYNETAIILEDTELTAISKDHFFDLLYNDKDIGFQFVRMLSANLSKMSLQLMRMAYDSVRQRVARALLVMNERYKEEDGFEMSREDLSNMVGTSKESLIRTLSDFKSDKVIDINNGVIFIKDFDELRDIIDY